MVDLSLYCNCHGEKLNKMTQFNQKNLLCGSFDIPNEKRTLLDGFAFDDTGDNISHLNKYFGELTGLYWVWKNTDEEIIGTNQYRIFWNEDDLSQVKFNKNEMAIVKKIDVNDYTKNNTKRLSTYEHFTYCHGDMGMILLRGMIGHRHCLTPTLRTHMIDNLDWTSSLHPYNMFVAGRKIFNKTCEILFDIIMEFYDRFGFLLDEISYKYDQIRLIDFLSERILHMIYMNSTYFFKDVELKEVSVIEYQH